MGRRRSEYDYGDSRFGEREIVYVDRAPRSHSGGSTCATIAWIVIAVLFVILVSGGWAVLAGLEKIGETAGIMNEGVMSGVREMAPAQRPMEVIEEMPYIPLEPDTLPKAPGDCSHIFWDDEAGAGSDFSLGYKDPCWWAFPPGMQKAALKDMQLHPEEYK